MKTAVAVFALYCCLSVAQGVAAERGGLIDKGSGEVSPIVESVVNNFRMLLEGSTIIVVNTDGDEQRELAKVKSFLAGKKRFSDAPEILESVKKQFRTNKTGFSHPIWLSDDSAKGNACVLGVRQNGRLSYTFLVSAKIDQPLIKGNGVRPIDGEVIQASIIAHEMFHCYEYLKGSMVDFWGQAFKMRMAYAMHRGESAADAYAALYVLQNYDAMTTLRTLMEFRIIGMLNSDVEHNTSLTVEYILKTFNRERLAMMPPVEIIRMAAAIRDEKTMDEKTFVALKKSAIDITSAYYSLLSEYPGLDLKQGQQQLLIETAMLMMDDAPQNIQLTTRVLNEITASLYKIGAGGAVSSRYYEPLLERYVIHASPKLRIAAVEVRGF